MEIKFSELDSQSQNQNPYEQSFNQPEKYWESYNKTSQNQPQTKKKKVSFDDILTNMNIVVNQSGVLQFMQPQPVQNESYEEGSYQQPYQEYVAQQVAQRQQQQQPQRQQQPLDPSVKHSFIYNKYFKDYKDESTLNQPQVRVPKTMEEYRQMLIDDRIAEIEQKKRIAAIKSTKMMFTTNVGNQGVIRATRNNLRSMSFH